MNRNGLTHAAKAQSSAARLIADARLHGLACGLLLLTILLLIGP